ncbi:MAG: hypothetical protein U9Q19_01340 [Pseudomonadota bacterium]|nr:hypothetical protein [Pseudomonadota bacterium]
MSYICENFRVVVLRQPLFFFLQLLNDGVKHVVLPPRLLQGQLARRGG